LSVIAILVLSSQLPTGSQKTPGAPPAQEHAQATPTAPASPEEEGAVEPDDHAEAGEDLGIGRRRHARDGEQPQRIEGRDLPKPPEGFALELMGHHPHRGRSPFSWEGARCFVLPTSDRGTASKEEPRSAAPRARILVLNRQRLAQAPRLYYVEVELPVDDYDRHFMRR
jgi:hypothetical protein